MANKNPSPATRFQPGRDSRGKQKGARDRLSTAFLTALADDFNAHGVAVLQEVRTKDPATYMRVCASVLPKDIDIARRPLEDISDEDLATAIDQLQRVIREQAPGEGQPQPKGPTTLNKTVNTKQQRFVAEYLIDLNATQVAIRAGYAKGKTAQVQGSRLLGGAKVAAAVAAGQAETANRLEITADKVCATWRKSAFPH